MYELTTCVVEVFVGMAILVTLFYDWKDVLKLTRSNAY